MAASQHCHLMCPSWALRSICGLPQRRARSSNRSREHVGQMEDMVEGMARMIDQQRRGSTRPAGFTDSFSSADGR